jgi:hypothetical protein
MAMDGYGGIVDVIPNRLAMSMIVCSPSSIPVRIAGRFRDM